MKHCFCYDRTFSELQVAARLGVKAKAKTNLRT